MGSRGRDSPPGPGRDRPSPPGGAVGRGTRPGDGWGPIGVTGRRPRCECIRVRCPPRPKWAVVPRRASGRVAEPGGAPERDRTPVKRAGACRWRLSSESWRKHPRQAGACLWGGVCYASSPLLRPFTLHCTRKRGVAEGEGA